MTMNAAGIAELVIWTVYDHPRDYPDKIVARKWVLDKPTQEVITRDSLEETGRRLLRLVRLVSVSIHVRFRPIGLGRELHRVHSFRCGLVDKASNVLVLKASHR